MCGVLALAGAAHGQSLWTQQTGTDSPPVQSAGVRPELLRDVALDQKLNDSIPLDLTFHDEKGRTVALRSFFGQKPVILTLVYYQCPMLCNQVLNSLAHSLKEVPLELGKDYEVVTVSIEMCIRDSDTDAPLSDGRRLGIADPASSRSSVAPVSYTHLDVYKRQLRGAR